MIAVAPPADYCGWDLSGFSMSTLCSSYSGAWDYASGDYSAIPLLLFDWSTLQTKLFKL